MSNIFASSFKQMCTDGENMFDCDLQDTYYLIVTVILRLLYYRVILLLHLYISILWLLLATYADDQSRSPLQPLVISTYNNQYKDPLFICCATTSIILVTRVRSFKTVTILYSSYWFIYRTITICIVFQMLDPVTYKILSISWRYR